MEILKREIEKEEKPKNRYRLLIISSFVIFLLILPIIVFISYREIKISRNCTGIVSPIEEVIPEKVLDFRYETYFPKKDYLIDYYYYTCSIKSKGIIETSKYYYKKLKLKLGEKIKKEKVITLDVTDKIKISNCDIQTRTIIQENDEFIVALGGKNDDLGLSVEQTKDGGYIMSGSTNSFRESSYEALIAKFDKFGKLEWAKTAGGKGDNYARFIQLTEDGGYIVIGSTTGYGSGGYDILIMKYDKENNLEWAKTAGGEKKEYAYSVKQTKDQGYVVAAMTTSYGAGETDGMILKYDKSGNLEWTKLLGGIEHDYIVSIDQTENDEYIMTGYTKSYGNFGRWDYLLVKLDEFGNLKWAKVTGGKRDDCALAVKKTIDNQYIVMGCSRSYSHKNIKRKFDILLIKYDQTGNVLWNRAVGGEDFEYSFSIDQTQDRGYVVVGYTRSYVKEVNGIDIFLYKYTESGELSWAKIIGDTGNEEAYSVQETQDKAYIIAGTTTGYGSDNQDILLVKVKPNESSIGSIIEPKTSRFSVNNKTIDLSSIKSQ